jgi:hypothetical protein
MMKIESIPTFTPVAFAFWDNIPEKIRRELIANVWCGRCRHDVIITNFSGTVKKGNLLLVGKCSECHGDVARVIHCKS